MSILILVAHLWPPVYILGMQTTPQRWGVLCPMPVSAKRFGVNQRWWSHGWTIAWKPFAIGETQTGLMLNTAKTRAYLFSVIVFYFPRCVHVDKWPSWAIWFGLIKPEIWSLHQMLAKSTNKKICILVQGPTVLYTNKAFKALTSSVEHGVLRYTIGRFWPSPVLSEVKSKESKLLSLNLEASILCFYFVR